MSLRRAVRLCSEGIMPCPSSFVSSHPRDNRRRWKPCACNANANRPRDACHENAGERNGLSLEKTTQILCCFADKMSKNSARNANRKSMQIDKRHGGALAHRVHTPTMNPPNHIDMNVNCDNAQMNALGIRNIAREKPFATHGDHRRNLAELPRGRPPGRPLERPSLSAPGGPPCAPSGCCVGAGSKTVTVE